MVALIYLAGFVTQLMAQESEQSFSELYDLVYQVQVLSPKAGSKSSIGSGFQVTADGLIVTNYHVVSSYVQNPSTHKIRFRSHLGESGTLSLVDFDVINDLAVLRRENPSERYLKFSGSELDKGETIFALGNPRDYGVTLVRGPSNGLVEHSYNRQLLFSGSLNPGMSGGPALDQQGNVVGVNVATAGSQLSFLVPASAAKALLNAATITAAVDYQTEIASQIKSWQRTRIQELIDSEWKLEKFANKDLFGEIRIDFQCWGSTNDDDPERYTERVSKSCRAANHLYLDRNLSAAELNFRFSKTRPVKLNSVQFSQSLIPSMGADNQSSFEHSTNYNCHVGFIQNEDPAVGYTRVTTCIRAYKKLAGLFDSLLYVEQTGQGQSFDSHLSVSAVEKDQIVELNRKFIEQVL